MNPPSHQGGAAWEAAYWIFQVVAWGAYVVAGLAMVLPQTGAQPAVIGGYVLFFFYSIALTHALRRFIRRRDWLTLLPGAAAVRLAAAALVVSAIQIGLILFVQFLWVGVRPWQISGAYLASMSASVAVATLLWTACYTGAAALLRTRRVRQNAMQLELAMREARLKALEAQLGPHFLFNCLNTLRGLILENPTVAQDVVTRLSNILRHNLTRGSQALEPLRDQLELTRDYLALESLRFEERLRTSFDIAAEAADEPAPAMLLQTLVENAIKHGISHLTEGGEVRVTARCERNQLVIAVENTGSLRPASTNSTRVGLQNLRDRLQALHGEQARLELTETNDTVRAEVRIPRRPSTQRHAAGSGR